jgi:hypothetical protein
MITAAAPTRNCSHSGGRSVPVCSLGPIPLLVGCWPATASKSIRSRTDMAHRHSLSGMLAREANARPKLHRCGQRRPSKGARVTGALRFLALRCSLVPVQILGATGSSCGQAVPGRVTGLRRERGVSCNAPRSRLPSLAAQGVSPANLPLKSYSSSFPIGTSNMGSHSPLVTTIAARRPEITPCRASCSANSRPRRAASFFAASIPASSMPS